MPEKYRVKLSDGREFDVETDGKPPSEEDVLASLNTEPGNIDLKKQPSVDNPAGGKSTVYSRSYNIDGKEVLLPSVTPDGRFLKTDDEVINEYKKTGKHLGKFNSVNEANKYAEQLHKDYESGKYKEKPEEQGWLSKAWHAVSDPLIDAPSRFAKTIADYVDSPSLDRSPAMAMAKGFGAGALEGIGDVVSGFTSPINLATMALTGGSSAAAKAGLSGVSRLASIGAKIASAPVAAHGAINVLSPDSSMSERGFGLAEMAGGIAGMRARLPEIAERTVKPLPENWRMGETPRVETPVADELPPIRRGARFTPNQFGSSAADLVDKPFDPSTLKGLERSFEPPAPFKAPEFKNKPRARLLTRDGVNLETGEEIKPKKPLQDEADSILSKYSEPQEMKTPSGGIAMGGASPRVLEVLGSSLYSRDRPSVVVKELLQNAIDEHKASGQTAPIKVHTNETDKGNTVTVRDFGRGLTPEELYTKFTNVGETGKAGVESASGGFGFAKAAPMLSGDHVAVESVVEEGGKKVKYIFSGTPKDLINQEKGVSLTRVSVDDSTPTGLKITTTFPNSTGLYQAADVVKNMGELSPSNVSDIEIHSGYGASSDKRLDTWMNSPEKVEPTYGIRVYKKQEPHPLQGTLETPGAKINIHFKPGEEGSQASGYQLHTLNKGLHQGSDWGSYGGGEVPNVPEHIMADIMAKVEEGHPDYPFTANREQLNTTVARAIKDWVHENVTSGAIKSRVGKLQQDFDNIKPIFQKVNFLDDGGRLAPEEINTFQSSKALKTGTRIMERVHDNILKVADTLDWTTKPSERLKKFGLLFKGPDTSGSTTLGIHIPNPGSPNESAILINLMEHLNNAVKHENPLDKLSTDLFATISHEQAHIPGGGHDTGFAYRHAQLLSALGRKNTTQALDELAMAFGDLKSGQLNPELHELLSVYNESRKRAPRTDDALIRTGVGQKGQPNIPTGKAANASGFGSGKGPTGTVDQPGKVQQAYDLFRGMMSADLPFMSSAAFRQANSMIGTKPWFEAWGKAAKAFGSKAASDAMEMARQENPLFKPKPVLDNMGMPTGKTRPSYADEVGLRHGMLDKYSKRDEAIRGELAEKIPVYGRYIAASNRAYNAFLNHVSDSVFTSLIKDATKLHELGKSGGITGDLLSHKVVPDPMKDLTFGRSVAEFVNTSLRRGKLGVEAGSHEINLERNARLLSNVFFSPRTISSQIRMLNPSTYATAEPFLRKQYLTSMLRQVGVWWTIAELSKLGGAQVSKDPNSADFGKIRIGNTRIDPPGGLQQFLVLANRSLPEKLGGGGITSTDTGKFKPFGTGYKPETRASNAVKFGVNRLHPTLKFAYDLANASNQAPFHVADRALQMVLPMYADDLAQVAKEDPELAPMILGLSGAGVGTQSYERGSYGKPVFTPILGLEKYDVNVGAKR